MDRSSNRGKQIHKYSLHRKRVRLALARNVVKSKLAREGRRKRERKSRKNELTESFLE